VRHGVLSSRGGVRCKSCCFCARAPRRRRRCAIAAPSLQRAHVARACSHAIDARRHQAHNSELLLRTHVRADANALPAVCFDRRCSAEQQFNFPPSRFNQWEFQQTIGNYFGARSPDANSIHC
jgi:hypothetical protein